MTHLTMHSQTGQLIYEIDGGSVEVMQGHFHLEGDKVVARKHRGRNRYYLTNRASVILFTPKQKVENQS